jgi:holo-[acyl-carrier protein] synthase
MIIGLGVDVVEVSRIAKAMENDRFLNRILTEEERGTLDLEDKGILQRVAGRWAAKEAASKAIPTLNHWHDVEIFNREDGSPEITVHVPFEGKLWVSISHEKGHACAVVIAER